MGQLCKLMEYGTKNALESAIYSENKAQAPSYAILVTLRSQLSQISWLRRCLALALATEAIFTLWAFLAIELQLYTGWSLGTVKTTSRKAREIMKIDQIHQLHMSSEKKT